MKDGTSDCATILQRWQDNVLLGNTIPRSDFAHLEKCHICKNAIHRKIMEFSEIHTENYVRMDTAFQQILHPGVCKLIEDQRWDLNRVPQVERELMEKHLNTCQRCSQWFKRTYADYKKFTRIAFLADRVWQNQERVLKLCGIMVVANVLVSLISGIWFSGLVDDHSKPETVIGPHVTVTPINSVNVHDILLADTLTFLFITSMFLLVTFSMIALVILINMAPERPRPLSLRNRSRSY